MQLDSVFNSIRDLFRPSHHGRTLPGAPHLIFRDRYHDEIEDISNRLPEPITRSAKVELHDVDSFVQYVNDHVEPNRTAVFLVPAKNGKLPWARAVLDHLDKGEGKGSGWKRHTAQIMCGYSGRMERWSALFRAKTITQRQLAEAIEDHASDIVSPDHATLLEAVQDLTETRVVQRGAKASIRDGMRTFVYKEEGGGQGAMRVPATIELEVPLFRSSQNLTRLKVAVRYSWTDDGIEFTLACPDLLHHIEAEQSKLFGAIEDGVAGAFVYVGEPLD